MLITFHKYSDKRKLVSKRPHLWYRKNMTIWIVNVNELLELNLYLYSLSFSFIISNITVMQQTTCGTNIVVRPNITNDRIRSFIRGFWYGHRPVKDRKNLLILKYRVSKKSIALLQWIRNSHVARTRSLSLSQSHFLSFSQLL